MQFERRTEARLYVRLLRPDTTNNGGKARTVERSRGLEWSGEMASGEELGYAWPLG